MANMETISKEEILHIAKLSSLKIKDEEIEEYRKNLQDIVNFADTINSLDTSKIEVTNGTSSNVNVFREDVVEEFKDKDLLMENAPEKANNMFKIPKVIN